MCYSTESSYKNWLFTLIGCIIVLFNYQDYESIWIVSFVLIFSQIQVFEAIVWKNIESNKNDYKFNSYLTYLIIAQPLVNTLFGYNATGNKYLLYLLIAIIGVSFYSVFDKNNMHISKGKNNHLVWISNDNPINPGIIMKDSMILSVGLIIYLLGLFLPFFFIKNKTIKIYLLLYGLSTYLFSMINYKKSHEMSSYWCYIGTFFIYFYLLLKKII